MQAPSWDQVDNRIDLQREVQRQLEQERSLKAFAAGGTAYSQDQGEEAPFHQNVALEVAAKDWSHSYSDEKGQLQHRSRGAKKKKVRSTTESIWGDALCMDPNTKNNCFFEALIAGLEKHDIFWFTEAADLRNFLARSYGRSEYRQLLQ